MSFLTIAQNVSFSVGISTPATMLARRIEASREFQELYEYINEAGKEIARRVDWGQLTKSATLVGTGANIEFDMPADYSRLVSGVCVLAGANVVRPLSRAEWTNLTPSEGVPRYFLLEDNKIQFFPYLATGSNAVVTYQGVNWATGVDGDAEGFVNDADTGLFPESLMEKATIYRWKRQKGLPYQDRETEYEAALQDFARFNDRSRL